MFVYRVPRDPDGPNQLKDPDAVIDYGFDWSAWVDSAPGGPDELADATVEVAPADGTLQVVEMQHDRRRVRVRVAGGELGRTYRLTCRVVTVRGQRDERAITIAMVER